MLCDGVSLIPVLMFVMYIIFFVALLPVPPRFSILSLYI